MVINATKYSKGSSAVLFKITTVFIAFLLFSSFVNAQSYEIKFDSLNASGWFGGDNRDCCGPRNIAVGQSVLIDSNIVLHDFSFWFTNAFDFPQNPDGHGHEVTLVLNIRDETGVTLQTVRKVVADTFSGGWVTWDGIEREVAANTTLIFSTYLSGAFDVNQYFTGQGADQDAGYANGQRFVKGDTTDADMEEWTEWIVHSWDSNFWLRGTIQPVGIEDAPDNFAHKFALSQNYPNPFNPTTTIRYQVSQRAGVTLTIFDLTGKPIKTLVSGEQPVGVYEVQWDGKNSEGISVPSGIYIYRMVAGDFVETRKMAFIQ